MTKQPSRRPVSACWGAACLMFLSVAVVAAAADGPSAPPRCPDLDAYVQVLGDPFLLEVLYTHPSRLASGVAESGAISVNAEWEQGRRPDYYIEQQRYGGAWTQAAVFAHDRQLLEQAVRIIDWGFQRQADDGSFPGTRDPLHSVSYFVEASARAALLIQLRQGDEPTGVVERWKPKVHLAARWMAQPQLKAHGRASNLDPFSHRFFLRGLGLIEAAALTDDATLVQPALEYLHEGLAAQQDDGVLPERGGFDMNYQTLSVLYAARFYYFVPDADDRQAITDMMMRSLPLFEARVNEAGQVDLDDSSRIQELGRSGRKKTFSYKDAVQAFTLAYHVTADPRFLSLARRLAAGRGWIDSP